MASTAASSAEDEEDRAKEDLARVLGGGLGGLGGLGRGVVDFCRVGV